MKLLTFLLMLIAVPINTANAEVSHAYGDTSALNEYVAMTPASIAKVQAAHIALTTLGESYRFKTQVYVNGTKMAINTNGDPLFTGETVQALAVLIKNKGVDSVSTLYLDTSQAVDDITLDDEDVTDNPYNAPLSAMVFNFNTISFSSKNGMALKEPSTPLTPLASKYHKGPGDYSVNLRTAQEALAYTKEVIKKIFEDNGISVGEVVDNKGIDYHDPFLVYDPDHSLKDVIKVMMKYSTNSIANQLVLASRYAEFKTPASSEDFVTYIQATGTTLYGFEKSEFFDGSGLSRKNKTTAAEYLVVLEKFKPYKTLIKCKDDGVICAKTGTMKGVKTLAGYVNNTPFVIMSNSDKPFNRNAYLSKLISNGGSVSVAEESEFYDDY